MELILQTGLGIWLGFGLCAASVATWITAQDAWERHKRRRYIWKH